MRAIRLRVKNAKSYLVEAKTHPTDSDAYDHTDGNVDAQYKAKIKWHATLGGDSSVSKYTIEFRDLASDSLVWPFKEEANGCGEAQSGYTGPLVLPYALNGQPCDSVKLTAKSEDFTAKYKVTAEPAGTIDALDPMIIIRKHSFAAPNVALGAACIGLGFVAGALLATWLW